MTTENQERNRLEQNKIDALNRIAFEISALNFVIRIAGTIYAIDIIYKLLELSK